MIRAYPRGGGTFELKVVEGYSPALNDLARAVPGLHGGGKSAYGRRDAIEIAVASLRARGLAVDDSALTESPIVESDVWSTVAPVAVSLRPYQREGVAWLRQVKRGILADAMGLGKSLQAVLATADAKPCVVVVPAYVGPNWSGTSPAPGGASGHLGELQKWGSESVVCELIGGKSGRIRVSGGKPTPIRNGGLPEAAYYVVSYDSLHSWLPLLGHCRTTIFDEAHYVSNEKARRSLAARELAGRCNHVFLLTGTPLTNRPRNLWNLLDILAPGAFGNFFEFGRRYCGAMQVEVPGRGAVWNFDGASNLPELAARLNHYMLRRTLQDVALELPAKTRQILHIPCELTAPPDFQEERTERSRVDLQRALDVAADAKLPGVTEYAIAAAKEGQHVVVFTTRRCIASRITRDAISEGVVAACVTGDVHPARRLAIAAELAGRSDGSLFVATIDSAGVGIDLSYASVCIFAELTFEPHKLLQAEARLHRHGQRRPVLIQYPIATRSIDESILRVVVNRLENFETAIGATGESIAGDLSAAGDTDIMQELYKAMGDM